MAKKIAVINGKGGVGKTTSVINMADILAKSGYKVLLVDVDKQGNATMSMGKSVEFYTKDIYNLSRLFCEDMSSVVESEGEEVLKKYILDTPNANLKLIASNITQYTFLHNEIYENYKKDSFAMCYFGMNLGLIEELEIEFTKGKSKFDYIIIDTTPSTTEYTVLASLLAVDEYISPTKADSFSNSGIGMVATTAEYAKEFLPEGVIFESEYKGAFLTDVKENTSIVKVWDEEYKRVSMLSPDDKNYVPYVRPYIRSSSAVLEANSSYCTLDDYGAAGYNSNAYKDYISLLKNLGYIDNEHMKKLREYHKRKSLLKKVPVQLSEILK